jgi:hypothetical protein
MAGPNFLLLKAERSGNATAKGEFCNKDFDLLSHVTRVCTLPGLFLFYDCSLYLADEILSSIFLSLGRCLENLIE